MSEDILVSKHDGWVEIAFNRPALKNALNLSMYEAATAALAEAAADAAVRVVIFRGEGGSFTSGNDLNDFIQNPPTDEHSPVFGFLRALVDFEKPLIAAVEGHAVGIGTTMLLHCDLAYAAESAKFQLPFVNLALVPEAGASYILPAMVGHRHAAELLLLGERFGAAEARRVGIINAVLPDAESLLAHARERAAKLARLAPTAVRESKRLMKAPTRDAIWQVMKVEAGVFADRLQSPELMEAVSAFFERRQPDFSKF
jgi:enoyl-CoA hydratase/carnithine racemase